PRAISNPSQQKNPERKDHLKLGQLNPSGGESLVAKLATIIAYIATRESKPSRIAGPESPHRGHQQSGRTRNTPCAVSPRILSFSASFKVAPSTTFLGSGSPMGKGWSDPSIIFSAPAFFTRYSSESASNTQESKYIASKPLRGSAYLPCELAWLRARRPSA